MNSFGRKKDIGQNEWKDILEKAEFIKAVTPVTSLIVLESEADYERFGIKKKSGGLGSSSLQDSFLKSKDGTVPEPEEWIFFIVSLIFAVWIFRKFSTVSAGR